MPECCAHHLALPAGSVLMTVGGNHCRTDAAHSQELRDRLYGRRACMVPLCVVISRMTEQGKAGASDVHSTVHMDGAEGVVSLCMLTATEAAQEQMRRTCKQSAVLFNRMNDTV